jgi:hypothetical protein
MEYDHATGRWIDHTPPWMALARRRYFRLVLTVAEESIDEDARGVGRAAVIRGFSHWGDQDFRDSALRHAISRDFLPSLRQKARGTLAGFPACDIEQANALALFAVDVKILWAALRESRGLPVDDDAVDDDEPP